LQDQAWTAGNRRDGHLGPDVERIKQVLRDDLDVSDGELSDVTFLKTGVGESAASDEMRFDALRAADRVAFAQTFTPRSPVGLWFARLETPRGCA
jgi:hypothetical protein